MFINQLNIVVLTAINILCRDVLVIALVEFKSDPVTLKKSELSFFNAIAASEWLEFTKRGIESNEREKRLEGNLVASDVVVKNGTISHVQLLDTLPSVEAQRDSELADEIMRSSLYIYNAKCAPHSIPGDHCAAILTNIELPESSDLAQKCKSMVNDSNNGHYPMRRLLPRNYKDGFYRMFSNIPAQPLSISLALGGSQSKDSIEFLDGYQRNLAVVQWSQFVANDLSKPVVTSMSDGSLIECCNQENTKLAPRYHHPACEPLISKDLINTYGAETCLNYVRSALAVGNKCTFAPREQLNQATAKLDLSQLYGYNLKTQSRMRLYQDGLLKSTGSGSLKDSLLPMATKETNWFCAFSPGDGTNTACFMAGDSRVNNNPFAIVIHTVMMRNHNRIAKELRLKHPDWQDEELFQKAKSINIGIYKRIVFNEWLPIILGTSMANEIMSTKKVSTNDEAFKQISNEYAVAASRFFLSMMPNELHNYAAQRETGSQKDESAQKLDTRIFILKDEIYSPSIEYSSGKLDKILYSLLNQRAMKLDLSYVESLIPDLRNNKRPTHPDLLAFDIQRNRDHGLQPYFKYLEVCNNLKINDWSDLQRFIKAENLNKLKSAYTSWRDIDLIVGGISETPVDNATVGPTFQCIIGEQFLKLWQGDHDDIDQNDYDLLKWKTVTAADLLCINSNLQHMPSNIFQISSNNNPMMTCADRLKQLSLNENY